MGIFDKKKSMSRPEFKERFLRDRGKNPGSTRNYRRRERQQLAKEFGPKYGSEISTFDYRQKIRELGNAGRNSKTSAEKKVFEDKIKILKNLGGKSF